MNKILLPSFLLGLLLGVPGASAQNPVIRNQFSADPTARVFGDRVYLFPSHDIISPVEPERRWFSMADYHVFSSADLTDWTDHGVIVSQEDVPWGKPDAYSMWAPDCVEKNGKYYFYFPDAVKEGFGFAVGVAVADRPEGPYTPEKHPIEGVYGIDPVVLQCSDGSACLIWAGMGLRGARLSDDMLSLEGEPVRLDEGLPEGFKEGPFAFEKDGRYYLTYPWVRDKTETLAYAMSDSPLGPYTFKGLIMEQSPVSCWTNHHSLVEFKGQWYLFYHHNDYSPDFDKNRSVRIDKITFNEDGTILPVTPTLRGVGNTPATSLIQVDRYSQLYPVGTGLEFLDPSDTFQGWYVILSRPGTWVRYNSVDFGEAPLSAVCARVRSPKGGSLRIFIPGDDETDIATLALPASSDWTTVESAGITPPQNLQDIMVQVKEGSADIDWISFK